jgi:hypothetical protein
VRQRAEVQALLRQVRRVQGYRYNLAARVPPFAAVRPLIRKSQGSIPATP